MQVTFKRHIKLPDPATLQRCVRGPELGPGILFFSGGSALKALSRELIAYTHNSIHIITPFDSGGSSAVLRNSFDMPAIGDLRSRLMALADRSVLGYPEIRTLFSHRLGSKHSQGALERELQEMIRGTHPMVGSIPLPMRTIIRRYLHRFYSNMDRFFDLHGANIGNLVLTGGFLANDRDLESTLFIFSQLVKVRGKVNAVLSDPLHLGGRLRDGTIVHGQHALTGKEVPPIAAPVAEIFLCGPSGDIPPVPPAISTEVHNQIAGADLICYPMGSFYTSLIANLLPHGVGQAVQKARCPKIYIPSTGQDPETIGMDIGEQVRTLLNYLRNDAPGSISTEDVLDFVLLDRNSKAYGTDVDRRSLEKFGIRVLEADLGTEAEDTPLSPKKLVHLLVSLA
ncbi:GAK system CofD-like protein [Desulfoplanes sp.]